MGTNCSKCEPLCVDGNEVMQVYFLDFEEFKSHGKMPRRPDSQRMLTKVEDVDNKECFIVFISHCWIAGWDGSSDWRGAPHPDDMEGMHVYVYMLWYLILASSDMHIHTL